MLKNRFAATRRGSTTAVWRRSEFLWRSECSRFAALGLQPTRRPRRNVRLNDVRFRLLGARNGFSAPVRGYLLWEHWITLSGTSCFCLPVHQPSSNLLKKLELSLQSTVGRFGQTPATQSQKVQPMRHQRRLRPTAESAFPAIAL